MTFLPNGLDGTESYRVVPRKDRYLCVYLSLDWLTRRRATS